LGTRHPRRKSYPHLITKTKLTLTNRNPNPNFTQPTRLTILNLTNLTVPVK